MTINDTEEPVAQTASLRALENGYTAEKLFKMVKRVKPSIAIPMLFMSYEMDAQSITSAKYP